MNPLPSLVSRLRLGRGEPNFKGSAKDTPLSFDTPESMSGSHGLLP